jgi:predicted CopG family antitoxin
MISKSYTNAIDSETTTTNRRRTISVDPKVYLRLEELGRFGESFSELVGRLLDLLNERKGLEQERKAVTGDRSI